MLKGKLIMPQVDLLTQKVDTHFGTEGVLGWVFFDLVIGS